MKTLTRINMYTKKQKKEAIEKMYEKGYINNKWRKIFLKDNGLIIKYDKRMTY